MSAAAARPRAVPRAKKAAIEPASPSAVIDQICGLVGRLDEFLYEAGRIGESGDLGQRLMRVTSEVLISRFHTALQPEAFSSATVECALDVLYDVEGALHGVKAMHPDDGRGALMEMALALLHQASDLMELPNFWPTDPQFEAGEIGAGGTITDKSIALDQASRAEPAPSARPSATPAAAAPLDTSEREDLGEEVLSINRLISWVFSARDVLDSVRHSAEQDQAFRADLRNRGIRYNSGDWVGNDVGNAMAHVLIYQRRLIQGMTR